MKKIKKALIKYIIMVIICILICIICDGFSSKKQIMNNLDYNITLNQDGSATIVENWDIYINKTNTLFRTFEKSEKFGKITDINVKDLDTGENLTQIYEEMYHVTDNCFYGLDIGENKFEIAWGTGMEEKSGTKKYEISYTVTDTVSDCKDCQEFYWKLLDESNSIPINKVAGKIKMPKSVEDTNNLKVWGHGPLDGKIEISNNDLVEFSIDKLNKTRMLEVRILTAEKQFNVNPDKTKKSYNMKSIIKEENIWSEEANNKSMAFKVFLIGIYVAVFVINVIKAIKYYKESLKKDDKKEIRLKYYRDIPREESSTPAEAIYISSFKEKGTFIKDKQSNIVTATILYLALKKYISLKVQKNQVFIKILKEPNGLKGDEKAVYELLKLVQQENKEKDEFEIGEIHKYAKENYYKYSILIDKLVNEARESLYKIKLVDKSRQKDYDKASSAGAKYIMLKYIIEFLLVWFLLGLIPIIKRTYISIWGIRCIPDFITWALLLSPMIFSLLVKYKMCERVQGKISVITESGKEEKKQWNALMNYIQDFSKMEEKEVPNIVIWEKYLVYATAFGIAQKAIMQMKAKYPEVFVKEYWQDENIEKFQIINLATYNFINDVPNKSNIDRIVTETERAYKTSISEIAKHSSSGSSSGGGRRILRRRRRPEADGGRNGRSIIAEDI